MNHLGINLHAEADRERIESLQWQLAQRLLELGNIVIIEWGTWGKWERDRLRLRARELGASVEIHYLAVSLDVLFGRIQRRNMENPPITWEAVQKWGSISEIPGKDEIALFDPPLIPTDSSRARVS